jgi:nucleotide-binding universal stress UspA family protein
MRIPPRTVLAAVDFSDSSRVALTFAARLAKHCQAALHIVHAEEPLLVAAAAAQGIDLASETRDELAIFARSAPPAADCAPVFHAAAGAAATVIEDTARRVDADALVVGMRGISAAEHLMFGSTTEATLRTSPLPVFAVPDFWTPPQPASADLRGLGPVVAAVEPTDSAMRAAVAAARLAAALRTSTEAIHVVSRLRVLNRWQPQADALALKREEEARRALEPALAAAVSGPLELRIVTGNIADCVAKAIAPGHDRHPILVIGRRRDAGGATAYRILTLAKSPVLQYAETVAART